MGLRVLWSRVCVEAPSQGRESLDHWTVVISSASPSWWVALVPRPHPRLHTRGPMPSEIPRVSGAVCLESGGRFFLGHSGSLRLGFLTCSMGTQGQPVVFVPLSCLGAPAPRCVAARWALLPGAASICIFLWGPGTGGRSLLVALASF